MVAHDNQLHEYTWLIVMGSISAFGFGWGTGSNDVANAFGTAIGAKTITLMQATCIAAVFEFAGALILGRVSTSVIAGGIADIRVFEAEPEIYAYGMSCSLFVGTFFLYAASYYGLNVSSTHSIIGGIIGFSLVYAGSKGVKWYTHDPTVFPPAQGIVPIIASWFFTPTITGGFAAILFFSIRTLALRRQHSAEISLYLLPIFLFLTFWVCIFFVFTKGAAKTLAVNDQSWVEHHNRKSGWVAAVIAGGIALVALFLVPTMRTRINRKVKEDAQSRAPMVVNPKNSGKQVDDFEKGAMENGGVTAMPGGETQMMTLDQSSPQMGNAPMASISSNGGISNGSNVVAAAVGRDGSDASQKLLPQSSSKARSFLRTISKAATHGLTVDVHEGIEDDPIVAAIHARAEVFDPRAEQAFKYLQVFSAICVSFAHGAGDVGYMTGPLSAIWYAVKKGVLLSSVSPPIWIIIVGASGLVVGLATYGYNVTRAMGIKLSKLSPSRGFCAELCTAMVLMVASQLGLPTSSSQCITGGIIGVGLVEGAGGVNWKQMSMQVGSWMSTLIIMGMSTACLFAQGVYSPSIPLGASQLTYMSTLSQMTYGTIHNINSTLYSLKAASQVGVLPNLPYNVTASGMYSDLPYVDFVTLDKQLKVLKKELDTMNPVNFTSSNKNGTFRAHSYFQLQSRVYDLLNQISTINLGIVDRSSHTIVNLTDTTADCASTMAPYNGSASMGCPKGLIGLPYYINPRHPSSMINYTETFLQ